jgi:hypothetical protein
MKVVMFVPSMGPEDVGIVGLAETNEQVVSLVTDLFDTTVFNTLGDEDVVDINLIASPNYEYFTALETEDPEFPLPFEGRLLLPDFGVIVFDMEPGKFEYKDFLEGTWDTVPEAFVEGEYIVVK